MLRAFGLLGGTFDPVHDGHLALARLALAELDLEAVLLVPNADPPHKRDRPVSPGTQRAAMIELAIAAEPGLRLSRLELERAGPSYAVDTVAVYAAQAVAEGRPAPWFILSTEALAWFHTWREPGRILALGRLAVASRPGYPALDARWVAERFAGFEDRVVFLPGTGSDSSSTDIRARVAAELPIDGLVPPVVARYIEAHGLYGSQLVA